MLHPWTAFVIDSARAWTARRSWIQNRHENLQGSELVHMFSTLSLNAALLNTRTWITLARHLLYCLSVWFPSLYRRNLLLFTVWPKWNVQDLRKQRSKLSFSHLLMRLGSQWSTDWRWAPGYHIFTLLDSMIFFHPDILMDIWTIYDIFQH